MRSFEVEGRVYRSIPEFCRLNRVGYWRMIRLCRKYVRAHKDPAVAARWLLGLEVLNPAAEQKTYTALRENELSRYRMEVYRVTKRVRKKRRVLDEFRQNYS